MKHCRALMVAGLASLLLGACASTDNAPIPAPLPKITEFNQMERLWRNRVGAAEEFVVVP